MTTRVCSHTNALNWKEMLLWFFENGGKLLMEFFRHGMSLVLTLVSFNHLSALTLHPGVGVQTRAKTDKDTASDIAAH